jgi:phosphotransferase system enzyme I (PtsI)
VRAFQGIPVSGGSRVGVAVHHEAVPYSQDVERRSVAPSELPRERERLGAAVESALRGIEASRRALASQPEVGSIFEVHRLLLETVRGEIEAAIDAGSSVEHAVATVLRRYANRLAEVPDPMFAERRNDVLDVERRLLRALAGEDGEKPATGDGRTAVVVVAEDLTPAETAALAGRRVAGIVLEHGGPTSHTAIIAKALAVPCVVGVRGIVAAVAPGDDVWVDGTRGEVVVGPDAAARKEAARRASSWEEDERRLLAEAHLPAETRDGHRVTLLANVELPLEVAAAMTRGAAGIGLYRTEFLFDPSRPAPDEAAHLAAYRDALARVKPGRLTVRTFDFGSDKAIPGGASGESNPALGSRSLRWCFEHPDVFVPQLRALLRVAAEGDVRVMLPMVAGAEEVRRARAMLADAARALDAEGVAHVDAATLPVGVMVEVPAAVAVADLLAAEADFFSIGTNDLIQYGLAVDRTNERVATLFRPSHPSVLRWIEQVVLAARAAPRALPVTMCCEMGGDVAYAVLLLGLGIRELSLTPSAIPRVRHLVREWTLARARSVAARCRRLATADEVDAFLRRALEAAPATPLPAVAE